MSIRGAVTNNLSLRVVVTNGKSVLMRLNDHSTMTRKLEIAALTGLSNTAFVLLSIALKKGVEAKMESPNTGMLIAARVDNKFALNKYGSE